MALILRMPNPREMPVNALPRDSSRIEELVLRFDAVMAKTGTGISDPGSSVTDNGVGDTLQETQGDLSRHKITDKIESTNDVQKAAPVAVFWIGRGDAEPKKCEETKALTSLLPDGPVSRYQPLQPDVGRFLTKGLETLPEFWVR